MNEKYLIEFVGIALIAMTASSAFAAITWLDSPAVVCNEARYD